MKKNVIKYREVKELPKKAVSVKQYAEDMDFTTQYVYALIKRGKNNFEMVTFKGYNFVIPN